MAAARSELSFWKMTGAGNDFVLIDDQAETLQLQWSKIAPSLCDRRYGIGADGLLIIRSDPAADFLMEYYNADGSHGGMCGNGGRCAALYVMEQRSVDTVGFIAVKQPYSARRVGSSIRLSMQNPSAFRPSIRLNLSDSELAAHFINTGSPHVICFQEQVSLPIHDMDITGFNALSRKVRYHKDFAPDGTNVNFVEVQDQSTITMRTYERGVENETLACGTGAVAAAVVAHLLRGCKPPVSVRTRSNETLVVDFRDSGSGVRDVTLEGSARKVFKGFYCCDLKTGRLPQSSNY